MTTDRYISATIHAGDHNPGPVRVRIGASERRFRDTDTTGNDFTSPTPGDYHRNHTREKTMPIEKIIKYRTSDGTEKDTPEEAIAHERKYLIKQRIEEEVRKNYSLADTLEWTAVEVAQWVAENADIVRDIIKDACPEM
jgi:hypothetical protein